MKPSYIIIHHELGNQGFWGVNQYHQRLWNFQSALGFYIAYQYYIDKTGVVFQGRLDNEEGCHTVGRNFDSIGICLQGDLDNERPTEAQLISLKSLILRKMTQWAIPPDNIWGHRKYAPYKSCPGWNFTDTELKALFQPDVGYYNNLLNSLKDTLLKWKLKLGGRSISSECINQNSRG